MTVLTNIQEIFRLLKPEQIRAYLLAQGWCVAAAESSEQWAFEQDQGDGDSPARLWLWGSATHPKFRSRVPNAIFTLAVVENREALAIAQDILRIVPQIAADDAANSSPTDSAGTATLSPQDVERNSAAARDAGFWIVNSRREELRIESSDYSGAMVLRSGGRIWVKCAAGTPTVAVDDSGLSLRVTGIGALHIYCVPAGNRDRLVDGWRKVAESLSESDAAFAARLAACEAMLRQAEFVVEPSLGRDEAGVRSLCRQAAVVASALHGVWTGHLAGPGSARDVSASTIADARETVWQTAVFVLGLANLGLRWTPDAATELIDAVAADAGGAPERTADWLEKRTLLIAAAPTM